MRRDREDYGEKRATHKTSGWPDPHLQPPYRQLLLRRERIRHILPALRNVSGVLDQAFIPLCPNCRLVHGICTDEDDLLLPVTH